MKRSSMAVTSRNPIDAGWVPVDELADAWRAARDDTADAYREWCNAPVAQRRMAFTVYVAAADREAAAETAFLKALPVHSGIVEFDDSF
jgi:hypothetical protein